MIDRQEILVETGAMNDRYWTSHEQQEILLEPQTTKDTLEPQATDTGATNDRR